MTTALSPRDAAHGLLFGLALGDALGWPVEFESWDAIRARYGRDGIQHPPDPAIYTDDTQMTIALTEGLLAAGLIGLSFIRPGRPVVPAAEHPAPPASA